MRGAVGCRGGGAPGALAGPQQRKRGIEGARQPRDTAGYLRRPGGARRAFEDAEGGGEDSPRQREEGRQTSRVNWVTTQGYVKKMVEAIEQGELEARRRAQAHPQVLREEDRWRAEEEEGGEASQGLPCGRRPSEKQLRQAEVVTQQGMRHSMGKRTFEEVEVHAAPPTGSPPMSRRRLIEALSRRAEEC